jgi:hypothetical protein
MTEPTLHDIARGLTGCGDDDDETPDDLLDGARAREDPIKKRKEPTWAEQRIAGSRMEYFADLEYDITFPVASSFGG